MNSYIDLARVTQGWLYGEELEHLWNLATMAGPGDILEIGSWRGKSSVILGGGAKALGRTLWAVDTFLMDGTPKQRRVQYHSYTLVTLAPLLHDLRVIVARRPAEEGIASYAKNYRKGEREARAWYR